MALVLVGLLPTAMVWIFTSMALLPYPFELTLVLQLTVPAIKKKLQHLFSLNMCFTFELASDIFFNHTPHEEDQFGSCVTKRTHWSPSLTTTSHLTWNFSFILWRYD